MTDTEIPQEEEKRPPHSSSPKPKSWETKSFAFADPGGGMDGGKVETIIFRSSLAEYDESRGQESSITSCLGF